MMIMMKTPRTHYKDPKYCLLSKELSPVGQHPKTKTKKQKKKSYFVLFRTPTYDPMETRRRGV